MFGSGKYLYAAVVYLNGHKFYTYRTDDRTLKINDVVMVPVANQEPQPAIVAWVREFTEEDAPYPPEKTKWIIGRADRETVRLFAGMDLRMPYDISVKAIRDVDGKRVGVVTTAAEREVLRRKSDETQFKTVVTLHPEPAREKDRELFWF